jgi:hypothetical protein
MKRKVLITSFQAINKSSINLLLSILPLIFRSANTIWMGDGASVVYQQKLLQIIFPTKNLASFKLPSSRYDRFGGRCPRC